MSKKEFSPKELCELEKLAALSDDKIDTQDIPEAPAENWAFARRGAFYKPVKQFFRLTTCVGIKRHIGREIDHREGSNFRSIPNRPIYSVWHYRSDTGNRFSPQN